ncbi:hypothetical protein N658DRAFT_499705 [Parathielavia hyrcaniae]|uniref:Uncharacterized protein n=1 Tax=Parathielavia hyrcaniae TaxID=113614 RepID=A0AAN6PW35_9PEZI|nr:hypothetical protein N658DRAFT_499705 [Parathielavia hyrcaniae]
MSGLIKTSSVLLAWLLAMLALSATTALAQLRVPPHYSGEAQKLADPAYGHIPGMSEHYSSYWGLERPFPGNVTDPIFPTEAGPPGEDDHVWQDLLAAEWIIFEFYQQGIERFTEQDFITIGLPAHTRRRLMEIRNNEAGHLRIFQNMISPTSVKPGRCKYVFPLSDPLSYLAFTTVMEVSSMAFLSGLLQEAKNVRNQGAMAVLSQTESRHEAWLLMDIWKADPFAGPSDTEFPYAAQILDSTRSLIVPGSCPPENPEYPHNRQNLPAIFAAYDTKTVTPGSTITLNFTEPNNQPVFDASTQYHAVFFHNLHNISVPIETKDFPRKPIAVTIPKEFETKGVIMALIANQAGAPTKESVVAGPAAILEQPAEVGAALVNGGRVLGQAARQTSRGAGGTKAPTSVCLVLCTLSVLLLSL